MSRIKRHVMKKSLQNEKKEPKKKTMSKQMLMTIIIGGLMILSVFGIMFSSYNSPGEEAEYGEYRFQRTAEGWVTEVDGKKAVFSFLPEDISDLELSKDVVDKLVDSKVVYITFNTTTKNVQEFELMRYELAKSLSESFGVYTMPGILQEDDAYAQAVVDCNNATQATPVIKLSEMNDTNAYLDGNCIILEANEFSTIALKDRILYAMHGIIS